MSQLTNIFSSKPSAAQRKVSSIIATSPTNELFASPTLDTITTTATNNDFAAIGITARPSVNVTKLFIYRPWTKYKQNATCITNHFIPVEDNIAANAIYTQTRIRSAYTIFKFGIDTSISDNTGLQLAKLQHSLGHRPAVILGEGTSRRYIKLKKGKGVSGRRFVFAGHQYEWTIFKKSQGGDLVLYEIPMEQRARVTNVEDGGSGRRRRKSTELEVAKVEVARLVKIREGRQVSGSLLRMLTVNTDFVDELVALSTGLIMAGVQDFRDRDV